MLCAIVICYMGIQTSQRLHHYVCALLRRFISYDAVSLHEVVYINAYTFMLYIARLCDSVSVSTEVL